MNQFTFAVAETWSDLVPAKLKGELRMVHPYGGFDIESFEAGRNLWHARIKRADATPVVIDGVLFPVLELGVAWSDPDAAVADAKGHIDQFGRRYAAATISRAGRQASDRKASDRKAL